MTAVHEKLRARGVPLVSNQIQYSLLYRNPEQNGIIDVARKLGVQILAYCKFINTLLVYNAFPLL